MRLCKSIISILFFVSLALPITVPFVLEEPNVGSYSNEGAIAGIPFQKGEVTQLSALSLQGPEGPVAAQFNGLSKYDDGSYRWVLTSFLANLPYRAVQNYTVSTTTPTATVATPVTLSRAGSVVTIDNGVLRIRIDTVNFTGIDSLYYKGTAVVGGKSGGIFLNSYTDSKLYANGPVTKAGVVYEGPLRVSYRVQGNFFKASCGGIGYSYLLTVFAGSDKMRLDVSIRNSINERCGTFHQVQRCFVQMPLAFTPTTETAYNSQSDLSGLSKPDIKCFANTSSGIGLTVHESWGGGFYQGATALGANGKPTGRFQYHNIENSSGNLLIDIIVEQDASAPHNFATKGYEDGPYFNMIEGTHKNSDLFFSFGTASKNSSTLAAEVLTNRSMLLGRPDPKYLSETGAYGVLNHFGTVADEKETWHKFGAETTGIVQALVARSPGLQVVTAGSASTHFDMEEDPNEQHLLMWLRTGKRGNLDHAEGWARYQMTHWTIHTDGWEYDGCDHLVGPISNKATRTVIKQVPADTGIKAQNNATMDGPASSGWAGCHFGGQGLIDYYCLTGDPEALDAATDLGEYAWVQSWYHSDMKTPAKPLLPFTISESVPGGSVKDISRADTRPFKYLISFYNQLKRDQPIWKDRMTYAAKSWIRAWNRDPRGFLFDGREFLVGSQKNELLDTLNFPPELKNYLVANQISMVGIDAKFTPLVGDFEGRTNPWRNQVVMSKANGMGDTLRWFTRTDNNYWTYRMPQPMDLYFQLTGDEDARDLVMAYGQFLSLTPMAMDPCGFQNYYSIFDFPYPGMSVDNRYAKWNPATHAVCWGADFFSTTAKTLPEHNGAYGAFYPSVMALGYKYTGDPRILNKAFRTWNMNLKRGFNSLEYPVPELTASWGFVDIAAPTTLGDRITGGLALFYEATHRSDVTPPEAITDLVASHDPLNPGKVYTTFTAPADGGEGSVAEYQVKYDTVPIVEYDQFNFLTDYIFPAKGVKRAPWWYADNAKNESSVKPAGTTVLSSLVTGMNRSRNWYVAVRSRDNSGNLSPMSNLFILTPEMVSTESEMSGAHLFSLTGYPCPANPMVTLSYSLPKAEIPLIKIYDVSGRMIRNLTPIAAAHTGKVLWNGKETSGRSVASGVYYAKIVANGLSKQIRVVFVK